MNWHIGQEIVCVKSHSQGVVKKDRIYTIKGIMQSCCHISLDVGMKQTDRTGSGLFQLQCNLCNKSEPITTDNTWWFGESLFAPLMDISELESILNKEQIKEKV